MRPRTFTLSKVALAVVLTSALAFSGGPARAGTTGPIVDGNGVDYDAACVADAMLPAPPPNSIASPGGVGCPGVSVYDGSTELTDIRHVSLSSNAAGQIIGQCYFDGAIPPAGSPVFAALDSPAPIFTGSGCKVMFQNWTKQTNVPTNPVGGCADIVLGLPSFDTHGSWKDGYHHYVGYEVNWDGIRWVHSVHIGTYDPAPDGGFIYQELGTNNGTGWQNSNPHMLMGVNWNVLMAFGAPGSVTITVDGITKSPDPNCVGGIFKTAYATPGDWIVNVKGLTHSQNIVTLPVTVPTSTLCAPIGITCPPNILTVGGELYFSDTTAGVSVPGLFGLNIAGIAYTPGVARKAWAGEWLDVLASLAHLAGVSRKYGVLNAPDTLGEGPTCPTPTFGGLFPQNPLFAPNTACHIDDDPIARGTFLPEFWETPFGFVF